MSGKQQPFTILSDHNVSDIAKELEAGQGLILLADPEHLTYEPFRMTGIFKLRLFGKPVIDLRSGWLKTDFHQEDPMDREYRLSEKPCPSVQKASSLQKQLAALYRQPDPDQMRELYQEARASFERLLLRGDVGEYEFTISNLTETGIHMERTKFSHWQAYYIPRSESPLNAFTHALGWIFDRWNVQPVPKGWGPPFKFTPQHVQAIVNYALEDLRTGKVLAHNVQAGMDADALVGLA